MSTSHNNEQAFAIFDKYESSKTLSAVNGEIYAGPDPKEVSPQDMASLVILGWKPKSIDGTFTYTG